jgi:hypothetical protein
MNERAQAIQHHIELLAAKIESLTVELNMHTAINNLLPCNHHWMTYPESKTCCCAFCGVTVAKKLLNY